MILGQSAIKIVCLTFFPTKNNALAPWKRLAPWTPARPRPISSLVWFHFLWGPLININTLGLKSPVPKITCFKSLVALLFSRLASFGLVEESGDLGSTAPQGIIIFPGAQGPCCFNGREFENFVRKAMGPKIFKGSGPKNDLFKAPEPAKFRKVDTLGASDTLVGS